MIPFLHTRFVNGKKSSPIQILVLSKDKFFFTFFDNFVTESTQCFVHLKRIINLPKLIYACKAEQSLLLIGCFSRQNEPVCQTLFKLHPLIARH